MSQCRSDLHILLYFSIYIFPWNLYWTRRTGLHKFRGKKKFLIDFHYKVTMSETFENRKCPIPLMFLQGAVDTTLAQILKKESNIYHISLNHPTSRNPDFHSSIKKVMLNTHARGSKKISFLKSAFLKLKAVKFIDIDISKNSELI